MTLFDDNNNMPSLALSNMAAVAVNAVCIYVCMSGTELCKLGHLSQT